VTADEMRALDRIAIEDAGIAGVVLMETAGRAVAEAVADIHSQTSGGHVCVLCGKGNNGGDGFVVARTLSQWGFEVGCLLLSKRESITGDALVQLDAVDTLGIEVVEIDQGLDAVDGAADLIATAAVCVDAMLGTGLTQAVREPYASAIEQVNQSDAAVVAVDLPSGVSADTGQILGVAVQADATITFALHKRGLLTHPGAELAGTISVADIGIPTDAIEHLRPNTFLIDLDDPVLPARRPNSHKGHFGHVLIVGGSPGKGGAPLLAGLAALRSGTGLVTVLTDQRCQASLEGKIPELMVEAGWDEDRMDEDAVRSMATGKQAIVVGPGLATDSIGMAVLEVILETADTPVIIDAGALTLLADNPSILTNSANSRQVLTPHPGEAARLLSSTTSEVQADRFEALNALVSLSNSVVILKGAHSLIGEPGQTIHINTTGNPGMASAGTGDVLAGLIGSLAGRGLDPLEAAVCGTHLHGLAGDVVAEAIGQDSLIAGDLVHALARLLPLENND